MQQFYYNVMDTSYMPTAYSLHDEYEVAIMKKSQLAIHYLLFNGRMKRVIDAIAAFSLLIYELKIRKSLLAIWIRSCVRLNKITLLPL